MTTVRDYINQNVLITLDAWFFGPDSKEYKSVWGKLKGIHKVDELLGFTPNRPNVNWLFEVGDMIIYGCQVKYIILCPNQPETKGSKGWTIDAGKYVEYDKPNLIYISEHTIQTKCGAIIKGHVIDRGSNPKRAANC